MYNTSTDMPTYTYSHTYRHTYSTPTDTPKAHLQTPTEHL